MPKEQEREVTSSSAIYFQKEQFHWTKPLLHHIARKLIIVQALEQVSVCRTTRVLETMRVLRTCVQNNAGAQNSAEVQSSAGTHQNPVIMAGPKEKLPKFDGEGAIDPIRHYKTCETIWRANGITNTNEWV